MSVPTGSVDILKLDLYRILGVQEDATEKEVRIHKMRFINARNFNLTIMYVVYMIHCVLFCVEYFILYTQQVSHTLCNCVSLDCCICILQLFFKLVGFLLKQPNNTFFSLHR